MVAPGVATAVTELGIVVVSTGLKADVTASAKRRTAVCGIISGGVDRDLAIGVNLGSPTCMTDL